MTTKEILDMEFKSIREDLITKHEQLGMKASGNWERELEVKIETVSPIRAIATLSGEHYTQQLVEGREPGRFPPIQSIIDWIGFKGIRPIEENMKISSLAFLIARKIAREGTEYFKEGGTDLIESVVTPKRIQEIIDKIGDTQTTVIVNSFINQFQIKV